MSCANNELGILARRKIEAEIIKPIYQIWCVKSARCALRQ